MTNQSLMETATDPTATSPDAEARWQSVLMRDGRFDGSFVYAVRSTRVYCRPSCPSRRPGREQVTFYSSPEAAEELGYRPCRRCRPQEGLSGDLDTSLVRLACQQLQTGDLDATGPAQTAALVGTSPARLRRAFKRVTGLTFRQYADAYRMGQLKGRLRNGQDVVGALYDAGYSSTSRLYERAPAQMGMTPATYRRGAPGVPVVYTVADCYMGKLLVAATDKGVCAVRLGNDAAALETGLLAEFPEAQVKRQDGQLMDWVEAVLERMDGLSTSRDIPLDVQATAFQHRVWQHLMTIPYGKTQSYKQVAEALGAPGSARAVAGACAANPVALVVPCHRVVRQNGELGGYRWGVQRKAAILERESSND